MHVHLRDGTQVHMRDDLEAMLLVTLVSVRAHLDSVLEQLSLHAVTLYKSLPDGSVRKQRGGSLCY